MSQAPIAPQGERSLGEDTLSARELELVQLLARGLSNREIAQELVISPNTVKVHLRNIYAKLNVGSRTEATMAAVRRGWVQIETPQRDTQTAQEDTVAPQPTTTREEAVQEPQVTDIVRPTGPLALWQRLYLVLSALLVGLGLWLIWPDRGDRPGPFTDRPTLAAAQLPGPIARWRALAQMPTPRTRLAVIVQNRQIFALGGESLNGITGIVEIYTPETDDWRRGADMPVAVANVGAAPIGDRIYLPGGSTAGDQVSDLLQVYEPDSGEMGSWSQAAELSTGRSAYAIAAHEGALYLFGGWDGKAYIAETLRYDPRADVWTSLAPMAAPRAFAGAGAVGGRIYVVGGFDGQDELDTCEVYDPALDSWAQCPPMNAPRGGIGVTVIADTLYVIGGGWQSYLVENEYLSIPADPTQEAVWHTFPSPLLEEWRNLGVAANGTSIYAIGGWDGGFVGTNQAYRAVFRLYLPTAPGAGEGG
jgi:DNA-binding CsgD family transcriptional regulator/N-acetylneuraminic acid mutarotase